MRESVDLILLNGKIVTLDPFDRIVSALAIKAGRIISVGSDEEMRQISDPQTKIMDLRGRTVLPGLIDAHTHLGTATLSFRYRVDARVPPNKSLNDILDRIRERTRVTPPGEWIAAHGSMFGDLKLPEKRYPTKKELDQVAPDHPVVFMVTAHAQILNSRALAVTNIAKNTPEVAGTHIEKDPVTGEPTGVLREWSPLLPIRPFTYQQIKETLETVVPEYWVKQGCTSAYSFPTGPLELRAYQELMKEGRLPLRIQAMIYDAKKGPGSFESILQLGILPGLGNDWLRLGGVKIFLDGGFLGLSAAMNEPYLNMPGDYRGVLKVENSSSLNELVLRGHNAGIQFCIHASGDRAQDLALDAYQYALKMSPGPHRHRIEHLGNISTSPERIRRARELGLLPVTTIQWLYSEGDFLEPYLGPSRTKDCFVLRSLIDAGLRPSSSSDCAGTEPLSINPFFSIWCAVTRQTFFGKTLCPQEAISVREALRLYTIDAAYSGYEEHLKGSIEPGKLADLVVISRDILTIPENQIKEIHAEMVMIDGKIVYTAEKTN